MLRRHCDIYKISGHFFLALIADNFGILALFQALIVYSFGILALFQALIADSFGILALLQVLIAENLGILALFKALIVEFFFFNTLEKNKHPPRLEPMTDGITAQT